MGLTDTQLYIKQITNKDLLYSTRHYTQHFGTAGKGKESEYIYIYISGLVTASRKRMKGGAEPLQQTQKIHKERKNA